MPLNSQSPLILGLNYLFASPKDRVVPTAGNGGTGQLKAGAPLKERAAAYDYIAPSQADQKHIEGWPEDHQDLIRWVLVMSIEYDMPMSFAWEEVERPEHTRTIIMSFGTKMGVTFRSPYYVDRIQTQ